MTRSSLLLALSVVFLSPAVLRSEEAAVAAAKPAVHAKSAGALDAYDQELGRRLAAAAEAGNLGAFKGKCYTYVAWHMDAAGILGFYDWKAMGIEPQYSLDAADFIVWARQNEEKMRREMRLAVIPTPYNKLDVPIGSILVYDRGWCDFNADSGHIEILTAQDRACSDGCESLDQNCFSDPEIRKHVHVIIPVRN